jgi:hypothetical protein
MHNTIQMMLNRYNPKNNEERQHAIKEIIQEIALAGLSRGGFFKFAAFYGGTSLLILVGVVLDTLQQIESHLMMRHYDGLMKSGRIKGRTAVGGVV